MQKIKELPPIQPFARATRPIRQQFARLPQSQKDNLLVIILIAVLGFAGWYEYNGGKHIFTEDVVRITVRTVPSIKETQELYKHEAEVNAVAFSPDGQTLASGDDNGKIELWKVGEEGGKPRTLKAGDESNIIWSVAFSPDGKTLASGSQDGIIRLWNISEKKPSSEMNHKSGVNSVEFSPDGQTLASGSDDGTVKLWNVSKGTEILTIKAGEVIEVIKSVAFSPNGEIIASGSMDGTIKLWKVSDGKFIETLEQNRDSSVMSLAFSPSSGGLSLEQLVRGSWQEIIQLASANDDGTIKLWKIDESNHHRLGNPRILEGQQPIWAIAFSPDGKILASGREDGSIRLWNTANGNNLRILRSHPYRIYSLAFARKGDALASSSMDETVKIWKAEDRLHTGWTLPPIINIIKFW